MKTIDISNNVIGFQYAQQVALHGISPKKSGVNSEPDKAIFRTAKIIDVINPIKTPFNHTGIFFMK